MAVGAVVLSTTDALRRIDLVIYDALIRLQYRDTPAQVVIIAIDENSLRELGRWPWSRRIHAQLLERLTAQGARGIALDVILAEPESSDPAADGILADAISRNGRVVLPVAPEQGPSGHLISESLPLPELAVEAAALGHVDVELDVDGLCRSVYLRAGLGVPNWPALGSALYTVSGGQSQIAAEPHPYRKEGARLAWVRDQRILIPFAGPTGHFVRISYVDVLRERIPADMLRDRVVLVGATASGLGDALSTPAAIAHTRMSGVELNANVVNAFLEGGAIQDVPRIWRTAVSLMAVLFTLGFVILLPLNYGLLAVSIGSVVTLVGSTLLLVFAKLWFPPAVVLLFLALSYPLWSWLHAHSESQALQQRERLMERRSRYHPITKLPSRVVLIERLHAAVANAKRQQSKFAVMTLEIYRLGVGSGDDALAIVAEILSQAVREQDFVAQLSDDVFVLLIMDLDTIQLVEGIGYRITESFKQIGAATEIDVSYSVYIGASVYPNDGTIGLQLLENAFTAMRKARTDSVQGLHFFSKKMQAELTARLTLERELRFALERGELRVHYQPQFDALEGQVVGVETLLRWTNAELGEVPPTRFIPIAEQTGLIVPIGRWVLQEACHQAHKWRDNPFVNGPVAVNLSAVQLAQPDLFETVKEVLEVTHLPPHRLELEVTESTVMQNPEQAVETLSRLRRHGIHLSIDDFGTGYASFSYIKQFPVDRIKIDRSFVSEIRRGGNSAEIVLAIISMAHRLSIEVVAEGVERQEELEFLRSHDCDVVQGFLFAKPLPPDSMEKNLSDRGDTAGSTKP
jgi:diguanylate cyclase (GGDEF)-like protein